MSNFTVPIDQKKKAIEERLYKILEQLDEIRGVRGMAAERVKLNKEKDTLLDSLSSLLEQVG